MVCLRFLGAWLAAVVCLSCAAPAQSNKPPQKASLSSAPAEETLEARLDRLTRAALPEGPFASLSVAIIRGKDVIYRGAYGFAELNFRVPATPDTRYRLIGPGSALLSAAILRAAEQGKLSLEDEASRYLPEFPWGGRRVTIRQLLDATSGLQDYHYLGDDYVRTARTPKRSDEVTGWFAGRPFVHEPGAQYSWTISGYHLAGVILERITGEPYEQFVQREVLERGGIRGISYCDGARPIPLLARGYADAGETFSTDVTPSVTAVRFDSYCGSALDVAKLTAGLRRALRPESFQSLIIAQGAGLLASRTGAGGHALGVHWGREEGRRWWGTSSSLLLGYSGSWLTFPDEDLSVVVLANTGAVTWPLARNLARTMLGLPLVKSPSRPAPARAMPSTAAERAFVSGAYEGQRLNPRSQHRALRFTLCVYEEAGRLLGQFAGDPPFLLLKQEGGTFAGTEKEYKRRFLFKGTGSRSRDVDILEGETLTSQAVRSRDHCAV